MGLFKKLKEIFNKNIECGDEIDSRIVYLLKKRYLYINKNIFVREKNACVVVYKGRVCDVVFSGKYRINQDSIPETYGKAKIEKQQSKGKKIKRIRVELFFVNLEEFKQFSYISDSPFKSKTSGFGKVKGCLAGTCNIKVLDAGDLIKYLVGHFCKLKNKNINSKIELLVGNKINKLIQKNKVALEMLLNNQEYVESLINTDMQDALDKQGVFISNVKLKAVNFTKRHRGKVNEYLSTRPNNIQKFDVNTLLSSKVSVEDLKIPVRTEVVRHTAYHSTMQQNNQSQSFTNYIVCDKCQKKNSVNAKICINCGNKLN